ncbi:acyltransferase family protein [Chryseobacterium sp. 5_R23647]|uniref:acyltransferase family protein n=1 Tax=Chryseobacterium sp. 5_R23647 TaxID=2258964 RepID=UPI000E27DE0B|nr:acyltransferase [Chryseobacterium sp. 5_R23647]REC40417.1 hypothetical protein DRF69_18815 [Chryseobacterium sp. 5_R23647]
MNKSIKNNLPLLNNYRKDIDGLRAIAVMVVIIFHLGFLPNGYLGVDVFFVISGYLITKILYREAKENRFSIVQFYIRRIRRIIPLVVFCTLLSLIIGAMVMLPDDLENLSQSIIATNFMANNILLLITTGNYWDLSNEFKPLMHTWSLGIEEQFYFILPLIILVCKGKYVKLILPILLIFTLFSAVFFLLPNFANDASKFYLIQYRFFELAIGGIIGILFADQKLKFVGSFLCLFLLIILLTVNFDLKADFRLLMVVTLSAVFMITEKSKIERILLENAGVQFIGKISFSLYMWHQIVFAFARYFVYPDLDIFPNYLILIGITFILSIISYYLIEIPFRDKKKMSTKVVFLIVIGGIAIASLSSFYIYYKKGILKNIPELDMYTDQKYSGNVHIKYNERVYQINKPFSSDNKQKYLIVGNSFARDWANILLESKFGKNIEISYLIKLDNSNETKEKIEKADRIYFSDQEKSDFDKLNEQYHINVEKVWNVGTKNFGKNNGLIYNQRNDPNYCKLKIKMDENFFNKNEKQKLQWNNHYVDLIGMVIDSNKMIPVFTNECKFISSDTTHLTEFGAKYFAEILNKKENF